jgi:tRNA 2-thiocytidine biosynthesis protein TtcA
MTISPTLTKLEKKLLHYTGKAIDDFKMIRRGDKVLLCLSGGKDSLTMVNLLHLLQLKTNNKFQLHVITIDAGLPTFSAGALEVWLKAQQLSYEIVKTNIFNIVQAKSKSLNSYCVLCSRLRRGHIYTYAKKHGFNKIALGHHRDDLITSALMSMLYNGTIASMPPKLLTDDKKLIVIRPLVYCQEKDIMQYAQIKQFPVTGKELCVAKENPMRRKTQQLIESLAQNNPKVPSNLLHSLSNVKPSHLMDRRLWDFKELEQEVETNAD